MPLHQRDGACDRQFLEADLNLAGAGSLPNPFPPGAGVPSGEPRRCPAAAAPRSRGGVLRRTRP